MNQNRRPFRSPEKAAFTFRDLLGCLTALGVILALAIPTLANTKQRSDRAVCAGNLGIIGRAFNQWAFSHEGLYPVHVDYSNGGTKNYPSGANQNAWFQFAWISNEVTTPKVFACPSDQQAKGAQDFATFVINPQYRNLSMSYLLGWPRPFERRVLSGDFCIQGGRAEAGSVTGINPLYVLAKSRSNPRWAPNQLHAGFGNLLFNDGSVEWTDDARMRQVMHSYMETNGFFENQAEFLLPRFPY